MAKKTRTKPSSEGRLLEIRNLKIEAKVYPPGETPRLVTIVDGVSLTLERGKVLGLIGESGAGKSTIGLSSMAYGRGGVQITGGEVILNGRDILKAGKEGVRKLRGNEVCYVAQSAAAAFNPAHRLMDQVVEASVLHGTATRAEAEKLALQIAGFPPIAMTSDRQSAYESFDRDQAAAIQREMELSLEARRQESQSGAARFAKGEGRHGQFKK